MINPNTVNIARTVFIELFSKIENLHRPGIFPTEEGDLQAEWRLNDWIVTISFNELGKVILVDLLNKETLEERVDSFSGEDLDKISNLVFSLIS